MTHPERTAGVTERPQVERVGIPNDLAQGMQLRPHPRILGIRGNSQRALGRASGPRDGLEDRFPEEAR